MRIALVVPWYTANGGAEKVDTAICELYPTVDVFALFCRQSSIPPQLAEYPIYSSFLQQIPAVERVYRPLMGLLPYAVESLDLSGYDLVITSEWACVKGVITDPHTVHVCYCHTPMRHIWDLYRSYLRDAAWWQRPVYAWTTKKLREWDYFAAQRVSHFVANSAYIQRRIAKYYGRTSTVIYPPVDIHNGYLSRSTEDYYLSVSRLNRTKRVDLLIQACNALGRKLIVCGAGPEEHALHQIAGKTIEFVGRVSDDQLRSFYANCRALLFAADDDFGIVPVEAQSFGRPVIAFGRGGVLETVRSGAPERGSDTGVFFSEQTPASVCDGMLRFESREALFDPNAIKRHAQQFGPERFRESFSQLIDSACHCEKLRVCK